MSCIVQLDFEEYIVYLIVLAVFDLSHLASRPSCHSLCLLLQ